MKVRLIRRGPRLVVCGILRWMRDFITSSLVCHSQVTLPVVVLVFLVGQGEVSSDV